MSYKKISQQQARAWKRELEALQQQTRSDRVWIGGVHVRSFSLSAESKAALQTAHDLGHSLAARISGDTLYIYGMGKVR